MRWPIRKYIFFLNTVLISKKLDKKFIASGCASTLLAQGFILAPRKNYNASFYTKLDSWFVTGFCDAESSFMINVIKRPDIKVGWRESARFEIYLNKNNLPLLYLIKSYFGESGSIIIDKKRNKASFSINKLEHFLNFIIPQFDKFPLQSAAKQIEYSLWLKCIKLMKDNEHLTKAGLEKILSIKAVLNRGLSDKLVKEFPQISPIEKPVLSNLAFDNEQLNPLLISGFLNGKSDFSFFIVKDQTNDVKAILKIGFKELPILLRIKRFWGDLGYIHYDVVGKPKEFIITNRSDILEGLIPHFNQHPLIGHKLSIFNIWSEIVTSLATIDLTPGETGEKLESLIDNLIKITGNKGFNNFNIFNYGLDNSTTDQGKKESGFQKKYIQMQIHKRNL